MKVALVQAPVFDPNTPSNALALLSAHLGNDRIESRVFDASKGLAKRLSKELKKDFAGDGRLFFPMADKHPETTERLLGLEADRILAYDPDIVGFSVLARTEKHSLALARLLKSKDPSCRVVFGGAQCLRENMAFEFIEDPSVDAVALAEADLSFPAFIKELRRGAPLPKAPGMLVKRDGRVLDGGDAPVVADLDRLPFLDFGSYDLADYGGEILFLSTARGCVRKCSFCTHIVGQKTYRTMSAKRTVAEIRHQMERYPGRNAVEFTDSLVNGNVRRLGEVADLLIDYRMERVSKRRHGYWDFGWHGMAIIHPTMNPALLKRLRYSGCVQLRYGLESASQKVLDSMQKNMRIADAEQVIKDTAAAGISVFLYVLAGFPTETEADFQMTLDFLERNAKDITRVGVSSCEIQKGSHLDVHPESYGLRLPLDDRLRWETADGSNTYAVRQDRLRRLNATVERLGLAVQEFPTRLGSTLKSPEPQYDFYEA